MHCVSFLCAHVMHILVSCHFNTYVIKLITYLVMDDLWKLLVHIQVMFVLCFLQCNPPVNRR